MGWTVMKHFANTAVVICALMGIATAQWTPVATGIDYQKFTLSDPNDVYVARMERANTAATIDSMNSQGQLVGATRETVSGMAQRHDDTIAYWGQQWGQYTNDVKVAINGDFWDMTNNVQLSGHIQSGWYAKRFTNFTGGSGFVWTLNRDAFIGGCVNHSNAKNRVAYPASSQDQAINGVNVARGSDELILYTEHWNGNTGTDASGIEVLVELARPAMVLPLPSYAAGTVVEVHDGAGSTRIPFGHVVVSATGSAASKVRSNVSVGSEVRISQEITNYQPDCSTSRPGDWSKTYSAIGGNMIFLENGVVNPNSSNSGAIIRNPRTAIAYDATYVYFLVVDGRRPGSAGMTMQEIGNFCLNTLGADNGINLDGGGSSAMWVDGTIVNVPSDGSERPTYNGLMMVSLVPGQKSTAYGAGVVRNTIASSTLRLGPATTYDAVTTIPSGTSVTILSHDLNGILAKGENWWLADTGSATGWIAESTLENPAGVQESWQTYN